MVELQVLWAWTAARISTLRRASRTGEDGTEGRSEGGFTTLEWVAIAGVVIVAAVAIATVLMDKAKNGANNVNVQ